MVSGEMNLPYRSDIFFKGLSISKKSKNRVLPEYKNLIEAKSRIAPFIHKTPVLTSTAINRESGCELFFKCENFQRGGSFKMRGALNAILQLSAAQRNAGVTTHSSGNFAQAIALAANLTGTKAIVVMPGTAPEIKKKAVAGYGAEIIECEPKLKAREETVSELINRTGATFLHPSNDLNVIIGQGTSAMELLEDYPGLEILITPVGGGGLIAGTALAAKYISPSTKIYGGEPFGADDAYWSLKKGKIQNNLNPVTIADGLLTCLGDVNFPIIKKLVKDIIRVEEEEIIYAMRLIWERMKIIAEPSSAVALAAVLRMKDTFKNFRTGIILSGGNVDLTNLPF